jgi:drug/metabolite transporter (DMT)-like permease
LNTPAYRTWGLILALAGVVGFSFRPILIKLCYAEHPISPVTLLFLRMGLSLPVFAFVAWWLSRDQLQHDATQAGSNTSAALRGRDWLALLGLGFIGYYAASFLDFIGLQYIGAGLGRLIGFLYPTMVLALSFLFLHKRPTRRELAALCMTYAGVALVVSGQLGATGEDRWFIFGVLLCMSNALCYAIYLVAGSALTKRIGSMRFTAWTMIVATAPATVQFFILEPLSALALPAKAWTYILIMVVFATILPVFMVAEALKRIGANHFALIGAVSPVVTVLAGALGLDEPLTLLQISGGTLVISGVLLVSMKPKAT